MAATTRIRDEGTGIIVPAAQVPALVTIFAPAAAPVYPAPQRPAYLGQQAGDQQGYAQPQAYVQPAGYPPQGYIQPTGQPVYIQPGNPQTVGYATPSGMGGPPALQHQLTEFSTALVVILHIVTFGIFSLFYWTLIHGKFPKNRPDDPSGGKALGFCFIPVFNFYWCFFVFVRLIDRINEQRTARALPPVGKGLILTWLIVGILGLFSAYLSVIGLIIGCVALGMLQSSINEIVRVGVGQPMPAYR